jgi:hypothetical protein
MPVVSRFYGIVVRMYYNEHNPPHFHAVYGDSEALVTIESADFLAGDLPNRASKLVVEWAQLRRAELFVNWERMRDGEVPFPIDPLA